MEKSTREWTEDDLLQLKGTPESLRMDFKESRLLNDNNSNWEKTQQDIKSKPFRFQGYVNEAKETWTGRLIIKLDLPSDSGYLELEMDPEKDKEVATELKKGQLFTFAGMILSFILGYNSVSIDAEYLIFFP